MFYFLTYECQLTNNNWHNLCFHSPYFRDFDVKVFVFRDLFSDLCRGVLVGWYWHLDNLATSVAVVLDHYLYYRHVRWQLSIRIYLCVPKDCNLFNFGDRLRLVFIAPLPYFDFVNADTPFNGYIAIASLVLYLSKNSVLDVRDIQCMIYRLFLLVTSNSL